MEREFPANTVILQEGEEINSIYIIKEGVCSIYSERNPLKTKLGTKKGPHYVKLQDGKSEICMGLNQGNMSERFTFFPISTVSKNQWIGEECIFTNSNKLGYSIKTTSAVKVLEIGLQDFKDRVPKEFCEQLEQITLKKQYLKLERMRDIIKTSTSLREQQEMKNFFDTSINSLIKLHPHASKKILSQLGITL